MVVTHIDDDDLDSGISNAYNVEFYDGDIYTIVTHDSGIVTEWISDVERIHRRRLRHLIVGLDIEWRPHNRYQINPAATLQLCVGRRCLIFQLLYADEIPSSLESFLADDCYTFVGVGIQSDLEKLQRDHDFGYNVNNVDLRYLAADRYGREDLRRCGLRTLTNLVMDEDIEKPEFVTRSRWDQEWLTDDQIEYATIDAFTCFEIGRILNANRY